MEGYRTAYHKPEKKMKIVDRGDVVMQTRKCVGCKKTFKVTSKSPQVYGRGDCEQACNITVKPNARPRVISEELIKDIPLRGVFDGEVPKPTPWFNTTAWPKRKKEGKIKTSAAQTEEIDEALGGEVISIKGVDRQVDPEAKWQELVNRAKAKIHTMRVLRMEVAQNAIDACEINWGGGAHWKKFEDIRTLRHFAKEIGVHYKTLAQWCRVKRNIKDKLPEGLWKDDNYGIALRSDKRVKRAMSPEEVADIYKDEMLRNDQSLMLVQGIKRISSFRYFMLKHAKYTELKKEELIELRDYCVDITDRIETELGLESSLGPQKDGPHTSPPVS